VVTKEKLKELEDRYIDLRTSYQSRAKEELDLQIESGNLNLQVKQVFLFFAVSFSAFVITWNHMIGLCSFLLFLYSIYCFHEMVDFLVKKLRPRMEDLDREVSNLRRVWENYYRVYFEDEDEEGLLDLDLNLFLYKMNLELSSKKVSYYFRIVLEGVVMIKLFLIFGPGFSQAPNIWFFLVSLGLLSLFLFYVYEFCKLYLNSRVLKGQYKELRRINRSEESIGERIKFFREEEGDDDETNSDSGI